MKVEFSCYNFRFKNVLFVLYLFSPIKSWEMVHANGICHFIRHPYVEFYGPSAADAAVSRKYVTCSTCVKVKLVFSPVKSCEMVHAEGIGHFIRHPYIEFYGPSAADGDIIYRKYIIYGTCVKAKLVESTSSITVRGLPMGVEKDVILDHFKRFGSIKHCKVIHTESSSNFHGRAYVEFNDRSTALKAADERYPLICGAIVKVKLLKSHEPEKP